MPTFALVTPGRSALGPFELDDGEAQDGAVIRREGEPDRRVVGRIESDDPGGLTCSSSSVRDIGGPSLAT